MANCHGEISVLEDKKVAMRWSTYQRLLK